MAILGTQLSSHGGTWHEVSTTANNQFGYTVSAFTMPAHGYITRIGVFARQKAPASTRWVWLAIYALNAAGEPTELLGYTARLPVGGSGGEVAGDLVWSDPDRNGALTAVRLVQGERFAIVAKIEAPDPGSIEFAIPNALNTVTHYRRNHLTLNAPPTDPMGFASTATGPELGFFVDWTENDAPTVALDTPVDHAVVNSATPLFIAYFSDPDNVSPTFDKMSAYEIEVTRVSDGAVMWGGPGAVFPASQSERNAGILQRTYSGATLVPGVTYRYRINVRDDSGVRSQWSGYRDFTINALGVVDTAFDGLPTGVQDGDPTLIDFTGRWSHPTALTMTQAQIFLYRGGVLFKKSDLMTTSRTSAAAPGAPFTLSHSFTGFGNIPPGEYTYTIAGKASDNQWGPESSPPRAFVINSKPTTPSNIKPPSGSSSTARPLIEWNVDDLDVHDVFGVDDDSELEITRPDGSVATITTTDWDSTRGVGFWQATAAVFNQFGAYKIRIRGRDISAGTGVGGRGLGDWSTPVVLSYIAGPVVTILNPTEDEIVNTTIPTITWSVSGAVQASAQIVLYDQASATPLKAQTIIGTGTAFTLPVGWTTNGGKYAIAVIVTSTLGVLGASLRREFSVQFAAPATLANVSASGALERHDYHASPSSILVSWTPTVYPPGEFGGYVIRRRRATESAAQAKVLRTITSPGQLSWRDYWVESKTLMVYGVSQLRRVGGITLESPIVEVAYQIVLQVPILCSAYDAAAFRLPLMWMDRNYGMSTAVQSAKHVTWGSEGLPIGINVPRSNRMRRIKAGLTLKSDDRGTLDDHMADYEAMMSYGGPLLLRTERPEEQMYCEVEGDPEWRRGEGVGTREVTLTLIEISFQPGERGGS